MAETIEVGCYGYGFKKWHWYNIMFDLKKQGGLDDVVIDPLSFGAHSCGGELGDNRFCLTWAHNQFLLVTMQQFSQPLVDAFARVIEYQPFCRYERDGMVTIEWDKINPTGRFEELQAEDAIANLVAL